MSLPLLSNAGAPTNGRNEKQRVTPGGTISGGTFKITFETKQTGDIAWNASAAAVQAALEALSNVEVGDVIVTGGPVETAYFEIEFTQNLGGVDRTAVTIQSSLTGAAPTLTVTTPTAGITGTFRGSKPGQKMQDTVNGIIYENTGTAASPVWTVPAAGGTTDFVIPAGWANPSYTDSTHMPLNGGKNYSFGPVTT